MSYFDNRENAVQFVAEKLRLSKSGFPLTMIIGRDKSGDFFAHTVIDMQSEDTEEKPSKLSTNTSTENTPDG